MGTLPPSAAALNATGWRLELTDELLKSLIKGEFFHITPTHPYPGY
jgi:hypothetical protein